VSIEVVERRDRRAERHERTKREILAAAWALADERGLGGWSLRDVADAVGMRAPSLYVYFDSKNALYDALYREGYRALLDRIAATSRDGSPTEVLRRAAQVFFAFCVENPARHNLLFLHTIPGFEPSPASYRLAEQALVDLRGVLAEAGATSRAALDLWTALLTGLATQQVSNDPGGRRWARLVDDAVAMFLASQTRPRRRRA
jgi:AcrR family transcriptional regulator